MKREEVIDVLMCYYCKRLLDTREEYPGYYNWVYVCYDCYKTNKIVKAKDSKINRKEEYLEAHRLSRGMR